MRRVASAVVALKRQATPWPDRKLESLGGIMHLLACKDQKEQPFDAFYREVTQWEKPTSREIGAVMLALIDRLRALPNDRRVFGLTSHLRLCLLAEDTYRSPWFVIISALDSRNYFVEYLMPAHVAPWPHAYVKGEPRSEDDAVRMIEIAMDKSEGWNQR
jgi:hypothetical protein